MTSGLNAGPPSPRAANRIHGPRDVQFAISSGSNPPGSAFLWRREARKYLDGNFSPHHRSPVSHVTRSCGCHIDPALLYTNTPRLLLVICVSCEPREEALLKGLRRQTYLPMQCTEGFDAALESLNPKGSSHYDAPMWFGARMKTCSGSDEISRPSANQPARLEHGN
jgi:hypothetical protein